MPTAWELAQSELTKQLETRKQRTSQELAYRNLAEQLFTQANGFPMQSASGRIGANDPRISQAFGLARRALEDSGEAPLLFPQTMPAQPSIPNAAPITAPTRANLSPMLQAYQAYRNPWTPGQQQAPVAGNVIREGWGGSGGYRHTMGQPINTRLLQQPQSELNQWAEMTDTQGTPMERYMKWRDIYKPNNQGWQDKFQAERERAAAIKAGLINIWGGLQGQKAGANAQIQSAAQAAQAQKYQADLAHKTAMEQAKMQYALAMGQGGVKK